MTSRSGAVALGTAIVGLGVSVYLTVEHFSASLTLACPDTGAINCAKVTSSSYSKVAGIPVAVLGLVFFAGMTVLCLPRLWRIRQLNYLRLAGVLVGIGSVLYLVWAELFRIHAICLWCTVVHVCTLVLLGVVLWSLAE